MTQLNEPDQGQMPNSILRPLRIGFWGVFVVSACFVMWSLLAPLATTIHTTGRLVSTQPSYDIQHPFGGKIAEILVKEHANVEQGQALVEFDVTVEQAKYHEIAQVVQTLATENNAISDILQEKGLPDTMVENLGLQRYATMLAGLNFEKEQARVSQLALQQQAMKVADQIRSSQSRQTLLQARYAKQQDLVEKGTFRAAENEELQARILTVTAQIMSEQARLIALRQQAVQAKAGVEVTATRFRTNLMEQLASNQKRLPELRRQMLDLENQVEQSTVHAPKSGTVTTLNYDTNQMFVPRGETLLTLTRVNTEYQVAFTISPQAIDQVRTGMQGFAVLSSLPQRNLPKVRATIRSISPEAMRDRDGNVAGYNGIAVLHPDDLDGVLDAMQGRATLSIDMPVSIAFPGREVTFATFLVAPFLEFMSKAIQD
ncbi:MAG: HlyD family efflux transporter periplasmic adaptor subunit [Planktomarina sp.]